MSDLGDIDKTLRSGDADHDMTLRPADSADKTLRTEQQKILRLSPVNVIWSIQLVG